MSAINGFGSMSQVSQLYQNSTFTRNAKEAGKTDAAKSGDTSAVRQLKNAKQAESAGSVQEGVKLSEGAQKLLDELGIRMVPGSMIREARGNISQRKLATALGLSAGTVYHWEHQKVPEYKLWAILKVINSIK